MPIPTTPPLHLAVAKNDLEAVRSLIAAGVDLDEQDHLGRTALHDAVYRDPEILIELLAVGAQQKIRDQNGRTPLSDMRERFFDDELDDIRRRTASKRLAERVKSAFSTDGGLSADGTPDVVLGCSCAGARCTLSGGL